MLTLYNSLTRKKEAFKPIKKNSVGLYTCGPTVYDRVHIGNLRSFLLTDILRRVLVWNEYEINHIMNITDVGHLVSDGDTGEDKMTKGLKNAGKELTLSNMKQLAEEYTLLFQEDIKALNMLHPHTLPRASEHIEKQIEIIQTLFDKDIGYTTSDGVYFDTSKYPEYGKLGGLSEIDETHARIESNIEKRNQRDFALWKFNPEMGWDTPWGKGFPGWHIECSAMSTQYLGNHFDIHTGGIDNKPTHHNNEIAQTESATGEPFVNYWLHGEHVQVPEGKMSKSEGTGLTLETLIEKGYEPLTYRYWLLTGHYRSPVTFSFEALDAAQTAFDKLRSRFLAFGQKSAPPSAKYLEQFTAFINDDLNTPQALALVWDMLKDTKLSDAVKRATLLKFDEVLGLDLIHYTNKEIPMPEEIMNLLIQRKNAREKKDWETADKLREKIEKLGFRVIDEKFDGQSIEKI